MALHQASSATVLPPDGELVPIDAPDQPQDSLQPLAEWVVEKYQAWKEWRNNNYEKQWDTFERLWRGVWSASEQLRKSERSRIITPALSEAVENGAAEIEEATFGRGDYFDLKPKVGSDPRVAQMVDAVRAALKEDLATTDFAANAAECILNSAVFGTGIGEIVVKEIEIRVPKLDPMTGQPAAVTQRVPVAQLRSIHPRNFVIDPNAKTIDEALGVIIDENVGEHIIFEQQRNGVLRDVEIESGDGGEDPNLDSGRIDSKTEYEQDKIHVIRYYGKVPKRLLFPVTNEEQPVELFPKGEDDSPDDDGELVEAIVIVGNETTCLKAEENPWMMQDRPVVAFPWDVIPGRFYGRGICEKGENAQKLLDGEVRARMDSLALTTVPMVGIDATRMPRGFKFELAPGKSVLTNGRTSEIIEPFKFGQLDPNHWQNAESLQGMVQQATGSVNAAGIAQAGSDARSGAMSMAMAPIIKRVKRTMINFVDRFLMPAIEKITYRNMQYQPGRYPPVRMQFVPASTMGIMQREYETSQLTSLLATMQPGTAEHRAILSGIVANTSIPNRDAVIKLIESAEQREQQQMQMQMAQGQDPMAKQLAQVTMQLEIEEKMARIAELKSQAGLNSARTQTELLQPQLEAQKLATKGIYSVPEDRQQGEFDRRMQIADRMLKKREIDVKEKVADQQFQQGVENERTKRAELLMRARAPRVQ